MNALSKREGFRVIISGGGIAGLSLANALQHAGIDYVLLEARSIIAPQVGASISVMPNGGRILDQLGCYDEIVEQTEPLIWAGSHYETGEYIGVKSDGPQLLGARYVMQTHIVARDYQELVAEGSLLPARSRELQH